MAFSLGMKKKGKKERLGPGERRRETSYIYLSLPTGRRGQGGRGEEEGESSLFQEAAFCSPSLLKGKERLE